MGGLGQGMMQDPTRPLPIFGDGRAGCLRFASPAEANWRLEAWKSRKIAEKLMKIRFWRVGARYGGLMCGVRGRSETFFEAGDLEINED